MHPCQLYTTARGFLHCDLSTGRRGIFSKQPKTSSVNMQTTYTMWGNIIPHPQELQAVYTHPCQCRLAETPRNSHFHVITPIPQQMTAITPHMMSTYWQSPQQKTASMLHTMINEWQVVHMLIPQTIQIHGLMEATITDPPLMQDSILTWDMDSQSTSQHNRERRPHRRSSGNKRHHHQQFVNFVNDYEGQTSCHSCSGYLDGEHQA